MFIPLSAWINRKHPLPERFYTTNYVDYPTHDCGIWLSIEEVSDLYLANEMNWIGLTKARHITNNYLEQASDIIGGLDGGWLDSEERQMILEKLGDPPEPSLPLYLITCVQKNTEKLVYVGKTVNTNRFKGGHTAALKLHAPKFKNSHKKVYRSTVWLHHNDEYISLDWVQPEQLAVRLLDSVESQLIYTFQPELNIAKKAKNYAKWDFYIHIQNFLPNGFLNDKFI